MLMRRPEFRDVAGVYRVCDETGPTTTNPDLLGHVWAGPYLQALPEFARVLADEHGIAGYVLGCPDTRAFETWCEEYWWPPLREQYPRGSGSPSTADANLVEHLHHPPRTDDDLLEGFPAHLHIDLLPRAQGHGHGRTLMEWLFDALRQSGASGVHLGVSAENTNAIAFYRHLGFVEAGRDDDGVLMTRAL